MSYLSGFFVFWFIVGITCTIVFTVAYLFQLYENRYYIKQEINIALFNEYMIETKVFKNKRPVHYQKVIVKKDIHVKEELLIQRDNANNFLKTLKSINHK